MDSQAAFQELAPLSTAVWLLFLKHKLPNIKKGSKKPEYVHAL